MSPKKSIFEKLISLSERIRHFTFVLSGLSALLFIIFGIAFYLIYLDSVAIKEQIHQDFNDQQHVLAVQAASQVDNFLNSIRLEFNILKNQIDNNYSIRSEVLKSVLERNKDMGLIDIGLIDSNNKVIKYFKVKKIPDIKIPEFLEIIKHNISNEIHLGPTKIYTNDTSTKVVNILFSSISGKRNLKGFIFSRLCISQLFEKIIGQLRSGKTGYSWAINQDSIAIYHPKTEFIGKNMFEARSEKKPLVSFDQINIIMKEEMIKGETGEGMYQTWWHRGVQKQLTKLIAFVPVKNVMKSEGKVWSIAVVAPLSEVSKALDEAYWRHFAAEVLIVVGLFLVIAMTLAFHKKISSSLKKRVSEQEEYIRSILENSLDAIIFTDKENKIKVWSKGAEKIFGYTSEEMEGHSFRRLIPADQNPEEELKKIEKHILEKGYITNYVSPRIDKNGKRVICNISRTLIHSNDGEILGYTILIRDETEKMDIEHRIYNTEKLASIGTLAAGVAHEINNPLTVILGFTDFLLESFPPDSDEYADLKTIETNANNAKKIVENLLGFARITEGMDDIINVRQCIETVTNISKNTLLTNKTSLELNIAGNLPKIKGDAREFQQVIFNLINNAIASMKKSGGGKLRVTAGIDINTIVVEISDTGEGIPKKLKRKIFDPFFTTKKVGEGTGLGLSLCYGIMSKLGGKMTFESTSAVDYPGQPTGTTFSITLPIPEKNEKINNIS